MTMTIPEVADIKSTVRQRGQESAAPDNIFDMNKLCSTSNYRRYSESEFEKVFKPIRTFFKRHGMDVTFAGKTGPAADVIGVLAQQGKFDLLVMGSVVAKVMAICSTPILIVR